MLKRISTGLAVAAAALALFAAPATASRFRHHPVSKAQYASVHQWDEASYVEITWGLEGHRTNHWTNDLGTFKTKTYPTRIAGNTARAIFIRYTLDPVSDPHREYVWALYKTRWCVPAPTVDQPSHVTCAPTPPASS